MSADVGVIGLAVMGQNLVLNMRDHGFNVAVFNRSVEKVSEFVHGSSESRAGLLIPSFSLEEFVGAFKPGLPRRILLMVKAGRPVDDFIEALLPLLSPGDCIVDGGNSLYEDTRRRCDHVESKSLLYVGCGISGGEEGARHGPSLMPGGSKASWALLQPLLQAIAARSDSRPCCQWIGPSGAGHFVKMVHNGIEYGDMQLISEVYDIMTRGLLMSSSDMSGVFRQWNDSSSPLNSFLVEITADILAFQDSSDGTPLLPKIRDAAGQKGTGKWTVSAALDFGVPATLFAEAVFARCLSSQKNLREKASRVLDGPAGILETWKGHASPMDALQKALLAAKIISYVQGFSLIRQASLDFGWPLDCAGIAQVWQGGCIIRSALLGHIKRAFEEDPHLESLMLAPWFRGQLADCQEPLRHMVSACVLAGVPTPALSAALAHYDGMRSEILPANLIQAQRDYFGAHTYELLGNPGVFVHTNWTGRGGSASASNYHA